MTSSTATLPRPSPAGAAVGLWVFMGTAGILFLLFVAAYLMRMEGGDWSAIAMPWQLWLSTGLLIAGSMAMQGSARAAQRRHWRRTHGLLWAGGACAWAFLGVQLWAWQALYAAQVMPAGNPAASFFYLLTALHCLHVAGGLAAWVMAVVGSLRPGQGIGLCARYWHFLLAVWVLLFATLGGVTPQVVRFICGSA